MPLFLAVPYILTEALTFWAVARLIGVGWALLALSLVFFGGLFLATHQMRSIAVSAASGRQRPGEAMGNYGLIATGAVLMALPGFATAFLGLLLILPPTRSLIRRSLARKLRARIEEAGMRSFERVSAYRQRTSYGSFAGGEVIDEEEVQRWSRDVKPEDFR
ncbi:MULTISPECIES: FxsA family protein [unclassified Corynebacterium]|uniref:FxsA family protein n=1 Tax=unclassified Corynebacterium TaxID=2624378 RepID=UPI0029C9B6C2|nr:MULTISPECIES: FxsA family protein [unclassified Corynebacterium]WPF67180.1 FxsA family protein [Corynebacterium sp. 22KM0430]WPF69669.1 FxsA family protein [Corynebacterium sp. 21KM1197]